MDDSAGAHLMGQGLELRFDQTDRVGARAKQTRCRGQDASERVEGDVRHEQVDRLGNQRRRQLSSVRALERHHAIISLEAVIEQPITHVDGVHASSAALKKTVGEPAGARAEVEAHPTLGIEAEGRQAAIELEPASARVRVLAFMAHAKGCVGVHALAGLVNTPLTGHHPTGHDERARNLQVWCETSGHEKLIDASPRHQTSRSAMASTKASRLR